MEQDPHQQDESGNNPQQSGSQPEQTPKAGPKVYVASLSDYNAGLLHGAWLSADVGQEELAVGIQSMLAASPTPDAEEFGIFDFEGFGPIRLNEYEPVSTITELGRGIAENGPAFAHWAALVGTDDLDKLSDFGDAYRGHWESVEAYAEDLLDSFGASFYIEKEIPDHIQRYINVDYQGFARDLELGGEIMSSEGDGGVYIFDGST